METLQSRSLEHPEVQQAHHEAILQSPKRQMNSIAYEDIDEDLVMKAAIKTRGGCGPSGLEADNRRRILLFNHFGFSPSDPRKSIANFI